MKPMYCKIFLSVHAAIHNLRRLTVGRVFFVGLALILSTPVSSLAQVDTSVSLNAIDECVTLHDSLRLCYTYKTNPKRKAKALVVTLPMRSRTRATFGKIDDLFAERFPELSFLDFDLRGHGQSTIAGTDTLDFRTMSREEYTKIPHDIKDALRMIRKGHKELRRLPIIVIGASIGANSAGILANIENKVKAAALLSPGKDYLGLIPEPHLKMTDEKDILFMVGKQDTYSFESTNELYKMTEGRKVLHVYNSANHGTNIPNNNAQALQELTDWLGTVLKQIEKKNK